MNKQQVSGKWDEAKGKMKEGWGKATNSPATRVEGLVDQAKGKVKGFVGDVKEGMQKEHKRRKKEDERRGVKR